MGKVKAWLMQMEEDAEHMPKESWTFVYGEANLDIWYRIQQMQAIENLEKEYGKNKQGKARSVQNMGSDALFCDEQI
jgi:hypothetical protein